MLQKAKKSSNISLQASRMIGKGSSMKKNRHERLAEYMDCTKSPPLIPYFQPEFKVFQTRVELADSKEKTRSSKLNVKRYKDLDWVKRESTGSRYITDSKVHSKNKLSFERPTYLLDLKCSELQVGYMLIYNSITRFSTLGFQFSCPDNFFGIMYNVHPYFDKHIAYGYYQLKEDMNVLLLYTKVNFQFQVCKYLSNPHSTDPNALCPERCDWCKDTKISKDFQQDIPLIVFRFEKLSPEDANLLKDILPKSCKEVSAKEINRVGLKPKHTGTPEHLGRLGLHPKTRNIFFDIRDNAETVLLAKNEFVSSVESNTYTNVEKIPVSPVLDQFIDFSQFKSEYSQSELSTMCMRKPEYYSPNDSFRKSIPRVVTSALVLEEISQYSPLQKACLPPEKDNKQSISEEYPVSGIQKYMQDDKPHKLIPFNCKSVENFGNAKQKYVSSSRPPTQLLNDILRENKSSLTKSVYKSKPKQANTRLYYDKLDFLDDNLQPKKIRQDDIQSRRERPSRNKNKKPDEKTMIDLTNIDTSKRPAKSTSIQESPVMYAIYPPTPKKNGIPVSEEQVRCLEPATWLNDLVIDFMFQYYYHELSELNRQRTAVCSSYFCTIMSYQSDQVQSGNDKFISARGHTGNQDLLTKDYVLIPVNHDNLHWNFIVVCFPNMLRTEEVLDGSQASNREVKKIPTLLEKEPCILVFDSFPKIPPVVPTAVKNIRQYLECEFQNCKRPGKLVVNPTTLPAWVPKVPEQDNGYDCGIFVIQYMKSFCESFLGTDFPFPWPIIAFENWFQPSEINNMRPDLLNLFEKLHLEQETRGILKNQNLCDKLIKARGVGNTPS